MTGDVGYCGFCCSFFVLVFWGTKMGWGNGFAKSGWHDAVLSRHGAVLNGHHAKKYWLWVRV